MSDPVEPPPADPDLGRRQELSSPAVETGPTMTPVSPKRLWVLPVIRRVWATLWGWSGSDMRRIRCDRGGRLETVSGFGRVAELESKWLVWNAGEGEWDLHSWSKQADAIVWYSPDSIAIVKTRLTTGGDELYVPPGHCVYDGADRFSFGKEHVQHVGVSAFPLAGAVAPTLRVIAYTLLD